MKANSELIKPKISRNALLNYRLRIMASLLMTAIILSIPDFQDDPKRWAMMSFVIAWPHLFFWFARRAKSGYKAEGQNILLDNIFAGLLLPALGFRLFPCTLTLMSCWLNTFTYGGWRMMPYSIGLILLGVLLGYLFFGFDIHLDTEPLANGLSIFTILVYVIFIGVIMFRIRTGLREIRLALEAEREKSHELLLKVFPEAIIPRLNAGEAPITDQFADVTVLFTDIVGYTPLAEQLGPRKTLMMLNDLYRRFDKAAAEHGVEKIETVGDGYLAVGGAPDRLDHHPEAVAALAFALVEAANQVPVSQTEHVQIRVGIHTGPVFGGVVGEHRFHYAIFGETVNVASRVQSQSQPGRILVSETTYKRIRGSHKLEECGIFDLKGHGSMRTYWLLPDKQEDSL